MITPLQACFCFLVLPALVLLGELLVALAVVVTQQQWMTAAAIALIAFCCAQIVCNTAIATPFMFLYFKRMSHSNYSNLELWSTRAINLHHRLRLWKTAPYYSLKINRALCRIWLGHFGDAELDMREAAQVTHQPSNAINLSKNLAFAILKNSGSLEEAEELANKCLGALKKIGLDLDYAYCIFPLTNLGVIYFRQEKFQEAEEIFKKALNCKSPGTLTMSMFPMNFVYTRLNASLSLIQLLFRRSKDEEAFELLREAIRHIDSDPDSVSLECLDALSHVANELTQRRHFREAEFLLEHAYLLAGRNPDFPDAQMMLESYVTLLENTERASEVADLKRWIRPLHLLSALKEDQ